MLEKGLLIAAGIVVVGLVGWLLMRLDPNMRRWRMFDAELAIRPPMSDLRMMQDYFSESEVSVEVVGQVRRIFATNMEYPREKLLPDDDLSFFWYELDMVDLIRELESTFAITINRDDEFRTPCNIRSVSLLVHELRKNETAVSER